MRYIALFLLLCALPAYAEEDTGILADVSQRNIAVTSGFNGATTTLFGALPQEGDVIVVVSGPENTVVVRRKERVFGVWLNRSSATFNNVPGFYWMASSRPILDIVSAEWLASHRLGTDNLRFNIADATDFGSLQLFRHELVQLRQAHQLYTTVPEPVSIMGGRLYRADVHLPADAPTGNYLVTTYLFQRGQLVEAQQTPLALRKEGTMQDLSEISQNNRLAYAIMAVALALLAGWSSATLMRRS